MKTEYELNDTCWITVGDYGLTRGDVKRGRVVAELTIPNHPTVYYLIEVADTDHLHLEVRDALLMSEHEYTLAPFVSAGDPIPDNLLHGLHSLIVGEDDGYADDDDYEVIDEH